jgi:hypothetical protein
VQTAIAISAGLSQYQASPPSARKSSEARIKTLSQLRASPALHPRDASASPLLRPVPEHDSQSPDYPRSSLKEQKEEQGLHVRTTLRLDAFLGEWLSPDYFETITPPPSSTLMVAAAKAELLRPADNVDTFTPSSPTVSGGDLWGTKPVTRQHSHSVSNVTSSPLSHGIDGPLDDWNAFSRNLPARDRTNSLDTNPAPTSAASQKYSHSTAYIPPAPAYAISPVDPIPRGYVSHARDRCVKVDYAWDSMRESLAWGDGGRYGEEWSHMHKRFRHGLSSMVEWYGSPESESKLKHAATEVDEEEEDDEEDLVVVLVTHSAGCNALVGALTNQPVLLDFPMASLTMAVRKQHSSSSPYTSEDVSPVDSPTSGSSPAVGPADTLNRPVPRRRSSIDHGLSHYYDMKLLASSDHLRPGVDPSRPSTHVASSPVLSASQTAPPSRSRRFGSASSRAVSAGASLDADRNPPVNSSLGSMRRPSRPVVSPVMTSPILPSTRMRSASPSGLWNTQSVRDSDSPNFLNTLARSNSLAARLSATRSATPERSMSPKNVRVKPAVATSTPEDENKPTLPTVAGTPPSNLARSPSQRGLWGSTPSG